MKPTTSCLGRLDPRQPSERTIYKAALKAIASFDGDMGRARGWAIDEATRYQAEGDVRRNKVAVRLQRAIKALTQRCLEQGASNIR